MAEIEPLVALVSTVQSVLAIDLHTARYEVLDRGRGIYYGIARRSGPPMVAARREGMAHGGRPSGGAVLLTLDTSGPPTAALDPPIPLRDVHQMIDHDGNTLIVCSRDEQIVIHTPDDRWLRWNPIPESVDDAHHVNSILVADGIVHLLAHNWDQPSEVHRYRWPAHGFAAFGPGPTPQVELELLDSTTIGNMAHGIWPGSDSLAVASSAEGLIRWSDGRSVRVGGFTRGLAVTPDRIVVGRSLDAPRDERATADADLAVFDRSWNHLRDIILPGEGMVLDIRVPGVDDECDSAHDDEPWRFSPRGGWHRLPVRPAEGRR